MQGEEFVNVGCTASENNVELRSEVLPVSFRLNWFDGKPEFEVKHLKDGRIWPVLDRRPNNLGSGTQ